MSDATATIGLDTVMAEGELVVSAESGPIEVVPPRSRLRPDLSDVSLSDADREAALRASDYQGEIAADGVVTFAEYESMALQVVECNEVGGAFLKWPLELTAYSAYHMEFTFVRAGNTNQGATPDSADTAAASQNCQGTYWSVIGPAWSKAKLSTVPEAYLAEASDALWGCVKRSGVEMGDLRGLQAFQQITASTEALPRFIACQDKVFEIYRLPGFVGF